jgi:hypothetical protein
VWDGFNFSSHAVSILRGMERARENGRILVTGNPRDSNWSKHFPMSRWTMWDWSSLHETSEASAGSRVLSVVLMFRRTREEDDFRERLKAFVRESRSGSPGNRVTTHLIAAAESSPLALEQALRRLYPTKASIALGELSLRDRSEDPDSDIEQHDYPDESPSLPTNSNEIRGIQESLDALSADSKLDALLKYIRGEQLDGLGILIWCRYVSTALYLKTALGDVGRSIFVITSDSRPIDRHKALEQFEGEGGFLITTFAAMKGLEYSADVIVFYDALVANVSLAIGRALGAGKTVRVISLDDGSGRFSLPFAI